MRQTSLKIAQTSQEMKNSGFSLNFFSAMVEK